LIVFQKLLTIPHVAGLNRVYWLTIQGHPVLIRTFGRHEKGGLVRNFLLKIPTKAVIPPTY
ncbi:MAG: hypothetical protein VW878_07080, partial [Candidatus Poseidoniales archaeon]